MKGDGVSEVVGAIILLSVAVLAIGIVILVLFAGPLPTSVPAFSGLISNSSKAVYISHEGGDTLYTGQYKILVDGVDETYNFTKSLSGPFSLGKVMNATLPNVPRRVVMVFNTSWGGGTVLLSADLAKTVPFTPVGWYSLEWLYRKKITIDHTKVTADLTDFPVLINYQDSDLAQGTGKARIDANDVLFTSSDGMAKLPHEIESFTSNNGAIVTWVKVPTLSSAIDTVIYLYYGNPGASSQQNAADVWSNGYAGVWHLAEDAAGTGTVDLYRDSTSNTFHGDDYVSSTGKTGKVDSGQTFDGSDDYITMGTGCMVSNTWTLESWIRPAAPINYDRIFLQGSGACGSRQIMVYWHTNHVEAYHDTAGSPGNPQTASGAITADGTTWSHVVWTYDGSTDTIYVNGVTSSGATTGSNVGVGGNLYI
ncbi:MAG: DUF2341 domain-containing protein, partial [Methanomicrobiales archaeon]|nr:DUF2341 domain-containing protein [Methanomicrobiales archaeon]